MVVWIKRFTLIVGMALLFGSPAAAQEPVTIRFASWDTGTALEYQKQIAAAFEESHPNINVQVEAYGDGYDEKMAAAFGAGDPPDVAYMWNYPNYAPSLLPLNELVENDPDAQAHLESFYQNVLNYNRFQGKLYGLPVGFTTHVIYYNKDLFDQAGLPYPQDDWTWADFRNYAEQLTDASSNQFGCVLSASPDPYDWQAFFWSNGGAYISPDGTQLEGYMNSQANIETLSMLGGLVADGLCTLGGGNNQLSPSDLFATGKIGMEQDGIWPLSQYQASGINFGVVGLPSFEGHPVRNVINVSGISIAKDSDHKEAAWEFVKFFTSPEAQRLRQADLAVSPAVAQDFNDKNLLEDPVYSAFYQMVDNATETPAFLLTPNWNRISSNLSFAIESVLLGQDEAEHALNQAVLNSKRFVD